MKTIYKASLCISSGLLCLGFVAPALFYERTDLLSDGSMATANVDSKLVNAWGLASSPTGPFWIANEGSGTSSIVAADGSAVARDISVPADHSGHPTGIVFNGGDGFVVQQNNVSGPSRFIFVTLEGRLLGWSPDVDPANAIVAVDNGALGTVANGPTGAVYTGAALAMNDGFPFLYVTNFSGGTVDVFDGHFQAAGRFTDADVPTGYSPFGIATIDDRIYVTFVPRDAQSGDEIPGPGNGLIDVFNTDGQLQHRLVTGGELNAPWGLVKAPSGFGQFSNKLLVGNFGDGRILAYTHNGHFLKAMQGEDGEPIVIDGLWGLLFGNGGAGGDEHDLYFTAGPKAEAAGLFGEIELGH